jgi:hypothetical protein
MTFKTYQLADGSFAISSVNVPTEYTAVFGITPEDAYQIGRGAGLYVENGTLVIVPVPESETDPVLPTEGDF